MKIYHQLDLWPLKQRLPGSTTSSLRDVVVNSLAHVSRLVRRAPWTKCVRACVRVMLTLRLVLSHRDVESGVEVRGKVWMWGAKARVRSIHTAAGTDQPAAHHRTCTWQWVSTRRWDATIVMQWLSRFSLALRNGRTFLFARELKILYIFKFPMRD